jgi:ubiquinol-cytochrome c reductase cytochrome b subunit
VAGQDDVLATGAARRTAPPPARPGETWLERRTGLGALSGALLHVRIPIEARTWYLGGITLFLFGLQVATGTLLALYYKPTPDGAYDSVKFITSGVTFGWLIRSIHHWGANLMIISMVLHVIRIFWQGAYKHRREVVWLVGAGLLVVTIGFGFTGYLLPWDQRAFWATTVGTEIAGSVPIVGDSLLNLLRGGADVTEATLSRFFGMHVLVLPLLLAALIAVHLTIVHHLGLANPKKAEPDGPDPQGKLKPFFPNYVLDEVIAWYAVLALLVILASVLPAGLEDKANALETPPHIKPEWYFLSVYELLKLVPRLLGIVLPGIALGVLALLPFLDRNPEVRPRKRPIALGIGLLALGALAALTIMGAG